MALLALFIFLALSGCTNGLARQYVAMLNEREIPSCIKFDVGIMHAYSAAGGASLERCLMLFGE